MRINAPRPVTDGDMPWLIEFSLAERRQLERASGQACWGVRPGSESALGEELSGSFEHRDGLWLRTEHGYVRALTLGHEHAIVDLYVAEPYWETEGTSLLREVAAHGVAWHRAPLFDSAREAALLAAGFTLADQEWERPLPDHDVPLDHDLDNRFTEPGAKGLLRSVAPYRGISPQLLIAEIADRDGLARLEAWAVERGCSRMLARESDVGERGVATLKDAGFAPAVGMYISGNPADTAEVLTRRAEWVAPLHWPTGSE